MRCAASEHLTELARSLRKNPTEAENKLWNLLRNRQFDGFRFKRQEPVGKRYIADFYCPERKLIIELDGKIHQQPDRKEYDLRRDAEMKGAGLRILRIKNKDVLENMQYVEIMIRNELAALNPPLA